MSLTVSRLRSWSPEALPAAAADLRVTAQLLLRTQQRDHRAVDAMLWESPAAEAARAAAGNLVRALPSRDSSFDLQGDAVARVVGMFEAAQDLLARAVRLCGDPGLRMLEDGDVRPPPPVLMSADAPDAEKLCVAECFTAVDGARLRVEAMARGALQSATEADREAGAAVSAGDSLGVLLAGIAAAGVTRLSTASAILDGVERAESTGHSEYLTDRTTSQYGIAAVLAGVPRQAPLDEVSGTGDVLRRVGPLLVPGGR